MVRILLALPLVLAGCAAPGAWGGDQARPAARLSLDVVGKPLANLSFKTPFGRRIDTVGPDGEPVVVLVQASRDLRDGTDLVCEERMGVRDGRVVSYAATGNSC